MYFDLQFPGLCIAVIMAMNGVHASLAPGSWVRVCSLELWLPVATREEQDRVRWIGAALLAAAGILLALLRRG